MDLLSDLVDYQDEVDKMNGGVSKSLEFSTAEVDAELGCAIDETLRGMNSNAVERLEKHFITYEIQA